MKKELFDRQFKRLEKLFLKELTKEQLQQFHYELQPMTDQAFLQACHKIVKHERFFPSVSCFIDYGGLETQLKETITDEDVKDW